MSKMDTQVEIGQLATRYFAIWVLLASMVALMRPGTFSFALPYISPLLGAIMFGMGMTLSLEDFRIVLEKPGDVLIGVLAQVHHHAPGGIRHRPGPRPFP